MEPIPPSAIPPQPPIPSTPIVPPEPPKKKSFAWLVILVVLLLLTSTGVLAYQYYQLKTQIVNPAPSSQLTSTPLISPQPAAEADDPTTDWKTYTDKTYSFKYPPTWKVTPGSGATEEYFGGDYVSIVAPTPTVSIQIAPGVITYGFGGIPEEMEKIETKAENIEIKIDNEKYSAIESTRTENGKVKVFTDLTIPINGKEFHILFGTGYPVNQDDLASYTDYLTYRDTILQILATFKFTN